MVTKLTSKKCPRKDCKGNLELMDDNTYKCNHCEREFSNEEITNRSASVPKSAIERRYRNADYWEMYRDGIILEYESNGEAAAMEKFHIPKNMWSQLYIKWLSEGYIKLGNTYTRGPAIHGGIPSYPEWDESWDNDIKIAWLQNCPSMTGRIDV